MTPIWEEPVRGVYGDPAPLRLDGMERMLESVRRAWPPPPVHHLTGMRPTDVGLGRSTFAMPASPWLANPAGLLPGGAIAFIADAPLGSAIITGLPARRAMTTSQLTLSLVRPVVPNGAELIAEAQIIHGSRSVGLSQVRVSDGTGRLLAHGTCRGVIIDADPPAEMRPLGAAGPFAGPDPWQRPVVGAAYGAEVLDAYSGLAFFEAVRDGALEPPAIHHLTGLRFSDVADGAMRWHLPASKWLCSPAPFLYGGAIALLAEAALFGAVYTTVPRGSTAAQLDLKVTFLRPVFAGTGELVADATVVHRGRNVAVAHAQLTDAAGKTVALATGSAMLLAGGLSQLAL